MSDFCCCDCKYLERYGDEGEWECTGYNKVDCPYQDVDYNYIDFATGHKEINVVRCTKAERNGEMTNMVETP